MIAAPLFHSWGFFHFVMSLPTASTMVLRRRFDPEETLRAVQEQPRRRAGGGAGDGPADPQPAGARRSTPTTSPRCGSPRSRARRCRASWRSPGWTASATRSTTSTARPRSPTRRSPPRRTCAPRPAPPAGRRAGPWSGSSTRTGSEVPAGRGRADLRRQRNGLRGLHRRRRQGGHRRPALHRRRRPLRRRRAALHRRPRRRDDRLRRRERLPARGRGPARRPRRRRRGRGDRRRRRRVRPAAEGLRRRSTPGAELRRGRLKAHVRANLAGYKVPREIEFLDELPRNATGKVLKRELQARERGNPAEPRARADCGDGRRPARGVSSAARSKLPWNE